MNSSCTSETLKDFRAKHKLSYKELAALLGLHRSTISDLENGRNPIRHSVLLVLALERLEQKLRGGTQ